MENTLPPHAANKVCGIESIWFGTVANSRMKSGTSKILDKLLGGFDVSNLVFVFFLVLYRFAFNNR